MEAPVIFLMPQVAFQGEFSESRFKHPDIPTSICSPSFTNFTKAVLPHKSIVLSEMQKTKEEQIQNSPR